MARPKVSKVSLENEEENAKSCIFLSWASSSWKFPTSLMSPRQHLRALHLLKQEWWGFAPSPSQGSKKHWRGKSGHLEIKLCWPQEKHQDFTDQNPAHLEKTPWNNSEPVRPGLLGPQDLITPTLCPLYTPHHSPLRRAPLDSWRFLAFAPFSYSHSRVASPHRSLNLHFPTDERCWTSFHVCICHLCTSFDDVSTQIVCSFLILLTFESSSHILCTSPLSER